MDEFHTLERGLCVGIDRIFPADFLEAGASASRGLHGFGRRSTRVRPAAINLLMGDIVYNVTDIALPDAPTVRDHIADETQIAAGRPEGRPAIRSSGCI